MSHHANLETYCNESKLWQNELASLMGFPQKPDWSINVLKAVLTTIRDRTTIQEAFHLSAQLPVLIRGFFFEGYNPSNKPIKMNAETFMKEIKNRMGPSIDLSADNAFRAVLSLLYEKVSVGELEDIRHSMPKSIQSLWKSHMPKLAAR